MRFFLYFWFLFPLLPLIVRVRNWVTATDTDVVKGTARAVASTDGEVPRISRRSNQPTARHEYAQRILRGRGLLTIPEMFTSKRSAQMQESATEKQVFVNVSLAIPAMRASEKVVSMIALVTDAAFRSN